jgi:hypothetical protein
MEKVTVKVDNQNYDGTMFGYKFFNGVAKDVLLENAEYMVKRFGVKIVKPKQPEKIKEPEKTEQPEQPKKTTKKRASRKTSTSKKGE